MTSWPPDVATWPRDAKRAHLLRGGLCYVQTMITMRRITLVLVTVMACAWLSSIMPWWQEATTGDCYEPRRIASGVYDVGLEPESAAEIAARVIYANDNNCFTLGETQWAELKLNPSQTASNGASDD